jgi:hypothetical protein
MSQSHTGGYCRRFCLQYAMAISVRSCKSSNISPPDTYKFISLLIVPRIQPGGIFKYFPVFPSFHTQLSCQASLLSFEPHQEIPRGYQTPPNHNVLYAIDKDIFKVINEKSNGYLEISQCELTHASSSLTTLPQK